MRLNAACVVVALVAVAGCSRTEQLACGPAMPPITTAQPAPPPGFASPSFTGTAASSAPVAVATPAAEPALTAAQRRALNPMENRAAVAGR